MPKENGAVPPVPTKVDDIRAVMLHSDSLGIHEPRLPGTVPYDTVAPGTKPGWRRFLADKDCVVLGSPLGMWSSDTYEQRDPDNPDTRNFGDLDAFVFDPALWQWAKRSGRTTIWPILHPLPEDAPTSPELLVLQHALHAYEIRDPNEPVGLCCEGYSRSPSKAVCIDPLAIRHREEYRAAPYPHSIWIEALGPLLRPTAIEIRRRPAKSKARSVPPAEGTESHGGDAGPLPTPAPMKSPIVDLDLLALFPSAAGEGSVLCGRVGEGRVVILPIAKISSHAQVERLLAAARLIHCSLHEGLRPLLTSIPLTQAREKAPDDPSGTFTLREVAEWLAEIELEDDCKWNDEKVRSRMRKGKPGFFAELDAIRSPGTKQKIPRTPFIELIARHTSKRVEEVLAIHKARREVRRLRRAEGGSRDAEE